MKIMIIKNNWINKLLRKIINFFNKDICLIYIKEAKNVIDKKNFGIFEKKKSCRKKEKK
jgi:hypothetical protein